MAGIKDLYKRIGMLTPTMGTGLQNQYEITKDEDFKEIGRMFITGQAGYHLDLPDTITKELMEGGGLKETTKNIFIDKINNSRIPLNIKQVGKDHYRLIDYSKNVGDSRFNLSADLKDGKVKGNLGYNITDMPIANKTTFRLGTNINQGGKATGNLGFRYQPSKDAYIDAGARFDSQGDPYYEVKFGKQFSQGGVVEKDVDPRVSGEFINYGDYGRSYK